MMRVSTRSTYAIKALVDLIHNAKEIPIRLADIANRRKIPLPYLEQIFSKLTRAGVVVSIRGPKGGYQMAKSPSEISLADIVMTLEGPLEPVLCSQPENKSPTCHDVEGCVSRAICSELDNQLQKILSRNTLDIMSREGERLESFHHQVNR